GVSIIYTHLGKRRASRQGTADHITPASLRALKDLRDRWRSGGLELSSVSKLLDYLVLRDHLMVDVRSRIITFKADGIAFDRIGTAELSGQRFSFSGISEPGAWAVHGTDGPLSPKHETKNDITTFIF
ncbi:MAG TPA: hypothetical protein PK760_12080, partial [Flavobacteriales bacterium]|nr:hypothetical protein [Flavobacteriales bacterium]